MTHTWSTRAIVLSSFLMATVQFEPGSDLINSHGKQSTSNHSICALLKNPCLFCYLNIGVLFLFCEGNFSELNGHRQNFGSQGIIVCKSTLVVSVSQRKLEDRAGCGALHEYQTLHSSRFMCKGVTNFDSQFKRLSKGTIESLLIHFRN